jgi:hypothetical protein
MSAKRRVPPVVGGVAKKKSPADKPRGGSVLDRVRGLRAFGAKISNRMRAFPETVRESRLAVNRAASSRDDLRRRLQGGVSSDRWPRGQRVGVDDDEKDAMMDLRRRLAPKASSTSKTKSPREKRRGGDLRAVIDARDSRSHVPPTGGDRRVNELLRSLSLERYRDVFAAEEIDMDALRAMRDVDFEKLGVPYGPKVKIIANLRANRRR